MKKSFLKNIIILVCLSVSILSSQTYSLYFSNQHVSGSDFIFDIYMLNTGQDDLYLSDCDLVLTFNYQYFTNPSYQIVSSGISGFYTMGSIIKSSNRAILNLKRPTFSNQTEFNSRVTIISKTGDGTRIATMKITGISNTSGTAGLQWRTSGLNRNNCTFLANTDPWIATDKTSDATFSSGSDAALPVELVAFSANFQKGKVHLDWKTASEINNLGFELYRSTSGDSLYKLLSSYKENDDLKSKGQSNNTSEYTFVDKEVVLGQSYSYKLVDISFSGEIKEHEPVKVDVSLPDNMLSLSSTIPKEYDLRQNYPNPFNSITNIRFDVPLVTSGNYHVELIIYNQLGQKVKTLFNDALSPGKFKTQWDGKNSFGQGVASGMYFLVFHSNRYIKTIKILLLK